ncbi:hypothetical protein Tco_0121179 [Tanacetum coccineum]
MVLHSLSKSSSTTFITYQDFCLRQEILEYIDVHDNDASKSLQPSWGEERVLWSYQFKFQREVVYTWYGLWVNEDIGFVDLCWVYNSLCMVCMKYSASVRRFVADFLHVLLKG